MPDLTSNLTRRELLSALFAGAVVAACSGPRSLRDGATPSESRETAKSAPSPTAAPDEAEVAPSPATPTETNAIPSPTRPTSPTRTSQAPPSATPTPTEVVDPTQTVDPPPTQEPTAAPDDMVVVRTAYAAVVSPRLAVRNLPLEELTRIWNGEYRDWEKFGDPAASALKRVSVAGDTGPMDSSRADLSVPSLQVLAEFVRFNRGAIAFIPRDKVDFRFRTLRIDDQNILEQRVDDPFDGYPLTVERPVPNDDVPVVPEGTRPVSLTVLGDIIYGRYVHVRLAELGDFTASFKAIHDNTSWADITLGDLECSLSDSIPQPEEENPTTFLFKSVTANTEALKLGGVDILSRANNHSFNFGIRGMNHTTQALDEAGILHFGMGQNLEEARQATVVEAGGHTYAFLGYNGISDHWDGATASSAGTAPMLDWLVIEDIERERARGHIVIPYFHWGVEYVSDPTDQQRYFAHIAIDSGAAMVLGSHPHWVQATENYEGRPIIYSLGNFIFDQDWSVETTQGMYANVWMDGDHVLEIDLIPILIELEHRPRRLDSHEGEPILERVWAATDRLPGPS